MAGRDLESAMAGIPAEMWNVIQVMPAQYFAQCGSNHHFDGPQRLWLSVLEDALRTVSRGMPTRPKFRLAFLEAMEWLADESGDDRPGTIEFVCQALRLDRKALQMPSQLPRITRTPVMLRHSAVMR